MADVLVVGAGLAGLACALELERSGFEVVLLEAQPVAGGRVRTDELEGFRLDHGFQVLLTAYPEAQRVFDYPSLELGRFEPGSLVRTRGRFVRLGDPWRRPAQAVASALAPLGSLADKLRVARLRARVRRGSLEQLYSRPEESTAARLERLGFSADFRERFLRPLFAGTCLDPELQSSSRLFEFIFRMLAEGDTALPAGGMQALPGQLAAALPAGRLKLSSPVGAIDASSVVLADGERLEARAVVLATDVEQAAAQQPSLPRLGMRSVDCLYYAAERPPVEEPTLVLCGDRDEGPINNLCVPSQVVRGYAPPGAALVSVSVLQGPAAGAELEPAVRAQLRRWFGDAVDGWRLLRHYRIARALPRFVPPTPVPGSQATRLASGVYLCGDHRHTPSIQGALASGRATAVAVAGALAN